MGSLVQRTVSALQSARANHELDSLRIQGLYPSEGIRHATVDKKIAELLQELLTGQPAVHVDRQSRPCGFIDNGQYSKYSPIARAIRHEVVAPNVIRCCSRSHTLEPSASQRRFLWGCFWGTLSPPLFPKP